MGKRKSPELIAWSIALGGAAITIVFFGAVMLWRDGNSPQPVAENPPRPMKQLPDSAPPPIAPVVETPQTGLHSNEQPTPPETQQDAQDAPPTAPQTQPTPEPAWRPPLTSEEAQSFGLRRIEGKHLVLYTDLPSKPSVDELPRIFDLAVPQWCQYFQKSYEEVKNWRVAGSLMLDKSRFLRSGLLPQQMPEFLHGFQRGRSLWLYEQPSDFYRRHLLLHEGVHGFMNEQLGGCGPPWYMEGLAELLGTHRWDGERLEIGYSPQTKEEAPHWGRVKIIKDDYAAKRGLALLNVIAYGPRAHLKVEPYGWSWAAANFLDRHPSYRAAFRGMQEHANDNGPFFNEEFMHQIGESRARLGLEWQMYIGNMEYGYDVEREAITFKESASLPSSGAAVTVSAQRGWQASGYRVQAGQRYRITATGQFQIAMEDEPWISEPNGVTIRYYGKHPLGRLLAAVQNVDAPDSNGSTAFLQPVAIGLGAELIPERDGDLFFRLNDSPAELADNNGQAEVRIEPLAE